MKTDGLIPACRCALDESSMMTSGQTLSLASGVQSDFIMLGLDLAQYFFKNDLISLTAFYPVTRHKVSRHLTLPVSQFFKMWLKKQPVWLVQI